MQTQKPTVQIHPNLNLNPNLDLATIRTTARDFANPVDYQHPYPSMAQFANHLALSYDANRTRHSYYRQVRLIHQHLGCDPATLTEAQLRDYFLFVKLQKHWKPKSIRQARAAASMFFVRLLGRTDWTVFSQIRTKDHDTLPQVLTRQQVQDLLAHIRLRRYRTPLKLIYCCGLRLSECLGLTIHDIKGRENKLFIRHSKGHQDRVVPLPSSLYQELRRYWAFHRHPLLLFPNAGRGDNHSPASLANACTPPPAPCPVLPFSAWSLSPANNSICQRLPCTRCVIPLPHRCWKPAPTCTPSKSSWVINRSPPPWYICI